MKLRPEGIRILGLVADYLEKYPERYDFLNFYVPLGEQEPSGCILGLAGYYLGLGTLEEVGRKIGYPGNNFDQRFYDAMDGAVGHDNWTDSAPLAVQGIRKLIA